MSRKCGWKEEEIVDYVLSHLSSHKKAAFDHHLGHCAHCRHRLREWEATFGEGVAVENGIRPEKVKRRLMKNIRKTAARSNKIPFYKHPVVAAAMCAVLFGVLASGLFTGASNEVNSVSGSGLHSTVKQGYQHVRHVPVIEQNVNGYVWVNSATHEMMLFLQGIPRIDGKDYRAWLVFDDKRSDAGTLRLKDGMARLYFHGRDLEQARHIIIRVEPRRGSVRQTVPDGLMIKLSQ